MHLHRGFAAPADGGPGFTWCFGDNHSVLSGGYKLINSVKAVIKQFEDP